MSVTSVTVHKKRGFRTFWCVFMIHHRDRNHRFTIAGLCPQAFRNVILGAEIASQNFLLLQQGSGARAHVILVRGGGLGERGITVTEFISVKFQIKAEDRKSTRLNSSHVKLSYAVFCLKKKKSTR